MRYSDFAISFRLPRPNGTEIDVSSPIGAASGSLRVLPDLVETRRLLPGLWRDLVPQSLPTRRWPAIPQGRRQPAVPTRQWSRVAAQP